MENENFNLDFEKTCRICVAVNLKMKPLFEVIISDTYKIRMTDFIRRIASIKMTKNDGLPENVCLSCIEQVCGAYNFSQKCINSDRVLKLHRKQQDLNNIQQEILEEEDLTTLTNIDEGNLIFTDDYDISKAGDKNLIEVDEILTDYNDPLPTESCDEGKENSNQENLLLENVTSDCKFEIVYEDAKDDDNHETIENNSDEEDAPDVPPPSTKSKRYQKKYSCNTCFESFGSLDKLVKHEKLHDSSRPYKCEECSKTFSKKSHLNIHARAHMKVEDKQHVCDKCGQKFAYSYLLKQHSYKHAENKPFPCSKCNKGCLTAESLKRHMKIHADNYVQKKHECKVCSKVFPYPSFLAEHMKNHTGERPFLCSMCGKGFRQNGALAYHIRSHTGFKPYSCNICKNSFMSRGVLRVHMRRHTNERPFICDICGMGFRQSTDMKSHRRIHTGEKPILCTVCGKRMATTGQLTVHLRSHTGEKPFACDFCLKAFATKTMLVKHRRIHTGERPYVCNICGRAFNQSSTLKTHTKTHKIKLQKKQNSSVKIAPKIIVNNGIVLTIVKNIDDEGLIPIQSSRDNDDVASGSESVDENNVKTDCYSLMPAPVPLL